MHAQIGDRAAAGVIWLTLQKWAIRLSGIVTIAILTRFLSPEDFGVVAAASTVLPFFALLADLGFATYIVQADRADDEVLSTGFWFSLIAGVVLTVLLVVIAPVLGLLFQSDQVAPVLQVLALSVIVTGVSSVPIAVLRRRMEFRRLAIQGAISAGVAQVVAIGMTLGGLGVWALVGQALSQPFVLGVMAWATAGFRPRALFSWEKFHTMVRFGSQVLGVEFVAMLRAWAEAAIVTAALGLPALGYLNIAQRLVQVVQDLTGSALAPVSTVAFAKIREDRAHLLDSYLRALRLIYVVVSAPLTVVAVAAPLIVPLLFGAGWEPSFQVAQLLALAGIMVVGATLDHGLHYGTGRPGVWFCYAAVVDAVTVATTAVAVRWGLVGVGSGFLVVATLATVVRWFLVSRLLGARPSRIARPFGFLSIAVVASGAAGLLTMSVTDGQPALLRILAVSLAVAGVHLLIVWVLARPALAEVASYLRRLRQPAETADHRLRLNERSDP